MQKRKILRFAQFYELQITFYCARFRYVARALRMMKKSLYILKRWEGGVRLNFSATFLQKSKNSPFRTISHRGNVKSAVDSLTLKSPFLLAQFSTLFLAADLLERLTPFFRLSGKKSLYIFKRWERRFYRAIFEKEKKSMLCLISHPF
ncbi:MAG: hypothetical protein IJQ81_04215 [Oscillibacter sp.]|nr:hypothetical protein [Oscillibacter sp.]